MLQKLFNIQTLRVFPPPHPRLSIFIVHAEANSEKVFGETFLASHQLHENLRTRNSNIFLELA